MDSFYKSREWRELRYRVLRKLGKKCACCGITKDQGAIFQVDHIKPISKHPELKLCEDNLQVLCLECNLGKSNKFEDDFRSDSQSLKSVATPVKAEIYILNVCLYKPEFFEKVKELDLVSRIENREIVNLFGSAFKEIVNGKIDLDALVKVAVNRRYVALHLENPWQQLDYSGCTKLFSDCVRKIQENYLRRIARQRVLSLRGKSASEQLKHLEAIIDIHSERKKIQYGREIVVSDSETKSQRV